MLSTVRKNTEQALCASPSTLCASRCPLLPLGLALLLDRLTFKIAHIKIGVLLPATSPFRERRRMQNATDFVVGADSACLFDFKLFWPIQIWSHQERCRLEHFRFERYAVSKPRSRRTVGSRTRPNAPHETEYTTQHSSRQVNEKWGI